MFTNAHRRNVVKATMLFEPSELYERESSNDWSWWNETVLIYDLSFGCGCLPRLAKPLAERIVFLPRHYHRSHTNRSPPNSQFSWQRDSRIG